MHNIKDLTDFIKEAKETTVRQRRLKIPMTARDRHFIAFIDLEKAFDRVRRQKLIDKMKTANFEPAIIDSIVTQMRQTSSLINDEVIYQNIGVA